MFFINTVNNTDKYDDFQRDVFNALVKVVMRYRWDGISKNDIEYAVEWVLNSFYDIEESKYVEIDESMSLTEKKWNLTLNNLYISALTFS